MSAEAALPKEDTVDTNPVEKDLLRSSPAGTTSPVTAGSSNLFHGCLYTDCPEYTDGVQIHLSQRVQHHLPLHKRHCPWEKLPITTKELGTVLHRKMV